MILQSLVENPLGGNFVILECSYVSLQNSCKLLQQQQKSDGTSSTAHAISVRFEKKKKIAYPPP
jgi:hypothetical protein